MRHTAVVGLLILFCSGAMQSERGFAMRGESHSYDTSEQKPLFIFGEIEPVLRRQTTVPLRLPSFLPAVDKEHPIFGVLKSADRSGYDILLATELPCEGQNHCSYGSLRGSVIPLKHDGGTGVPVRLRAGLRGRFIKTVCHAYCTESFVQWRERGFYYSVGIKAGKKSAVVKTANSCIPE
jgi:hypothetical protein